MIVHANSEKVLKKYSHSRARSNCVRDSCKKDSNWGVALAFRRRACRPAPRGMRELRARAWVAVVQVEHHVPDDEAQHRPLDKADEAPLDVHAQRLTRRIWRTPPSAVALSVNPS